MDSLWSSIGQYTTQSGLHSVIIITVIEAVISLWNIRTPFLQIRFRLLALILPLIYLPVYFMFYPARAGDYFHRQTALFDFSQWLEIGLEFGLAIWHPFIAVLGLSTLYFLVKEAIPSIRHYFRSQSFLPVVHRDQFPRLDLILIRLAGVKDFPKPTILLSVEETPVIYTQGRQELIISPAILDILDDRELESVIAHELAHLTRKSYRINQISLVLRFLMFYNPIALLIFRRIINDNEKSCDDMAVQATGQRLALAAGLLKVFRQPEAAQSLPGTGNRRLPSPINTLQRGAYTNLIKERVERLVRPGRETVMPHQDFRFYATAVLLVVLLFYVV